MGNKSSSRIKNEITTNILNQAVTNLVNDNTVATTASASVDQTAVDIGTVEEGGVSLNLNISQKATIEVDVDATIEKLSKLDMASSLAAEVLAKIETMNKNQEPIIPGSSTDTTTTNIIKTNVKNIIEQNVTNIDKTTCSATARANQKGINIDLVKKGGVKIKTNISQEVTVKAIAKCIVSDTKLTEIANEIITKTESDLKAEQENKNVCSSPIDSFFGGITGMLGTMTMPFLIGMGILVIGFLIWWMNGGKDTADQGMQMYAQQKMPPTSSMHGRGMGLPNKWIESLLWWR